MNSLVDYLSVLASAYSTSDSKAVQSCFALELNYYHTLQGVLRNCHIQDVSALVLQHIPVSRSTNDSDRFQTLVADFLDYVSQFPPPALIASSSAIDGNKAYDSWAIIYSRAFSFFSLPDTAWFVPILRYIATTLVSLAMIVDQRSNSSKKPKTTDAAGRLSKSAGMAGNDRSQAQSIETKRAAVLMLANLSFKAYFKLNNTRLCESVLGRVENALKLNKIMQQAAHPDDETGELCYSRADRVTYRYYLGRIRLFQHNLKTASIHFRWAFDNCSNRHIHNKSTILIHLISTYLILGRYPNEALLSMSSLSPYFSTLILHLRRGNGYGVMQELDRHMDWFRRHGLYLILKEKLEITVWRNLARKCLVISRISAPPSSAPPTLRISLLYQAAKLSWKHEEIDMEDAESILASMIDQGFIKGYILHSKAMLVLQKGPYMGFPPIWSVFDGR